MNKIKRLIIYFVMVITCFSLSGCALINVNPEKDNAEVIATIDGKDILKSEFNNALALTQMNYEVGDQQWPTGHTLKTLKENLYDSIIQDNVFALQAHKDNAEVDEEAAKKTADETLQSIIDDLGEDQYENILEQNYSNPDTFKTWIQNNQIQSEYASKTTQKFQDDWEKDPKTILDQVVGKINDTDVDRGEYEYRLLGETLNYYMSNQSPLPTDEESMKETNKTIFEAINTTDANIKYCEDNKIDIPQEDIDSAKESLSSQTSYFFQDDSSKKQLLANYYLTPEEYDAYQTNQAKGDAAEDAIQAKCEEDVEIRDSEIQSYYNKNKNQYDTSKVSAMHILTEDKDAAESIYDEAKDITTKEDFQKLIDKYKDVENVSEATDLGEFDRATMVEEFSDAAFDAEPNTVVGPVQTQFGYHVIYVYDHKDGEIQPLEEVKSEIEETLRSEQGQEDYDKLEEKIVSGAHYDIPDSIKTPLEEYADKLEQDYHVEEKEGAIRA